MNLIFKIIIKSFKKMRLYESPLKRKFHKFLFKKNNNPIVIKNNTIPDIGYYKLSIGDFKKNNLGNNIEEVFLAADKLLSEKTNIKSSGKKSYLRNLLEEDNIITIKIFLNFVLNDFFVSKVKSYLREEPLLTELKLLVSPANGSSSKRFSGSQLFHRDFDDEKNIKIFFHLSDVGLESGPLQVIDKKISNFISKKNNLNYGLHSDKIENLAKQKVNVISLLGRKGDCYLVDTCQCYHRGSRTGQKDRIILYANFSTRSSFRFSPLFLKSKNHLIIQNHSPLSKYEYLVDKKKGSYLKNI